MDSSYPFYDRFVTTPSRRHSGFNGHGRAWAKAKPEAERVGEYMIRF